MNACRFVALVAALTVAAAVPANAHGRGHHEWDTDRGRAQGRDPRGARLSSGRAAAAQGPSLVPGGQARVPAGGRHGVRVPAARRDAAPAPDDRWAPLSWSVNAQIARDTDAVDGKRLPVIVFSHGATNDPIDYAHTLEALAAEGFVVAAPYHVNNTQDDVRVDFINPQISAVTGQPPPFACEDGLGSPCSHSVLARSMQDRVSDISAIVDTLPVWLGKHVDAAHVGVLGHSRGTVTALAAAGGSRTVGVPRTATRG